MEEESVTWQTDNPRMTGMYNCKVNGKRETLLWTRCVFNKKQFWKRLDGSDLPPNSQVEWNNEPVFRK